MGGNSDFKITLLMNSDIAKPQNCPNISIFIFACLLTYLSIHFLIQYVCLCLSTYLFVYLSVCLTFCLSVHQPVYLSMYLFACLVCSALSLSNFPPSPFPLPLTFSTSPPIFPLLLALSFISPPFPSLSITSSTFPISYSFPFSPFSSPASHFYSSFPSLPIPLAFPLSLG